jgi:hypothetical protein
VIALFAEYTGAHGPLEVDWPFERSVVPQMIPTVIMTEPLSASTPTETNAAAPVETPVLETIEPPPPQRAFASLWEFAIAVNRSDPAALVVAGNGAKAGIAIEGAEIRKLLGTLWFRGVVPKLSQEWRMRLLEAPPKPNTTTAFGPTN